MFVGSFVSHVELVWTVPECVAFMERLSTFCRVLLFDKPGVGESDPVPRVRTLDDRAAEIEAVMNAVGFEFTDIVASTQQAAATDDERWRALLHRFDEITAELTQRFGGTVVESTGDGHLITFDGPTQAIRCAEALRAEAENLGIEIRAGIHAGEILVSSTVRDLVVGSGTGFDDRGHVELRGVPGTWQLLAVDRQGPRAGSPEARLVSTPTPAPRGSCLEWPGSPRPPAENEQTGAGPPRDITRRIPP